MTTDAVRATVHAPPDIWGWCDPCGRWYFCAGWFDKAAPHPHCPVCQTEPSAIENRRRPRTADGDVPRSIRP